MAVESWRATFSGEISSGTVGTAASARKSASVATERETQSKSTPL